MVQRKSTTIDQSQTYFRSLRESETECFQIMIPATRKSVLHLHKMHLANFLIPVRTILGSVSGVRRCSNSIDYDKSRNQVGTRVREFVVRLHERDVYFN